jgi:hypothetical protein
VKIVHFLSSVKKRMNHTPAPLLEKERGRSGANVSVLKKERGESVAGMFPF